MQKIISTHYGKITGVTQNDYTVYRGIPYAKPPIGELRFREPLSPDPWEGVIQADTFGNRAMQISSDGEGFYGKEFYSIPDMIPAMSEDCLYLNIWVPKDSCDSSRCPVAIWLHGGGYSSGFGSEIEFDGAEYSRKGVILVTINYRLGIWGFLSHPLLSAESEHGVSGNYGIMDQIAAIRWVKENIAAFGGNPSNITIMGQSAGCMSAQTILSSPLAEGLIQKAILQSGGGYQGGFLFDKTLKEGEEQGKRLTDALGITCLEELRNAPNDKLLEASKMAMMESMEQTRKQRKYYFIFPFAPVIDGYVLPMGYDQSIEHNVIADIPYLIGSCRNDICVDEEYEMNPFATLIAKGAEGFAEYLTKKKRKNIFLYHFDRQLPGDEAGAFHSSELWYMFGTLNRCWRPFEERDWMLSERMIKYWTNFIKNGDPNGSHNPVWEPYYISKYQYVFDI